MLDYILKKIGLGDKVELLKSKRYINGALTYAYSVHVNGRYHSSISEQDFEQCVDLFERRHPGHDSIRSSFWFKYKG